MRHSPREPTKRAAAKIAQRGLAAAALGAACIACGDSPTQLQQQEPPPLTCPSAGVPLCSSPAATAAARDGTSDAAARSTAALENTTARAALATNLGQLDAALGTQNITNARAALGRVRDAISAGRGQLNQFPGDAPDLAAIELLLDQVAALLGAS
jgi:hypothetical protein